MGHNKFIPSFNKLIFSMCYIGVLVSSFCITHYPKMQGLKTTCIYCLTLSVGQEICMWLIWVLCFKVSCKAAVKESARSGVTSEGSTREGSTSSVHNYWQDSVLQKLKVSVSCWLLAEGHPQLLSHRAYCFIKLYKARRQQRGSASSKAEVTVSCNLITEVAFH